MKKIIALSLILSMVTANFTTTYATAPNNKNNTPEHNTQKAQKPNNDQEEFEDLKQDLLSDITNRSNQKNAKSNNKNPLEDFDRERVIYPEQEFPELDVNLNLAINLIQEIDDEIEEETTPVSVYKINDTRNFRVITANNSTYSSKKGTLMATSANVNVWCVDTGNSSAIELTDTMYNNILSQGQKIYDSMTTDIAQHKQIPTIWDFIPNVGDVDNDGKINILLYDINNDGSSSSNYVAGFFSANDMSTSNNNTPIDAFHMDIGSNQGGSYLNNDQYTYFFGTFAHEFQHMLYYSYLGWKTFGVESLWINESLSGFTDMYYGGGAYSTTQIPDSSKFQYGLKNEYNDGLATEYDYGDFFNFNNSLKNYGIGYYFSAFMHELYGQDYIQKMYEYFDDITLSFDGDDTFTLSDSSKEIFTSNYKNLFSQDQEYLTQTIFGSALNNVLDNKLEYTDTLNYIYRLFMEAFISDGGKTELNGDTINYPKLWNGDDLWTYRVKYITNTLKTDDVLNLKGYNGSVDEQSTHEMAYYIPKVLSNDENLIITVGDDKTDDSLYVYVALLNEDNSAELIQLTLGEETRIETGDRETYLFANTLYNNVTDVVVKYEWEEYVEPEVEKEKYSVSFNLTNISHDGDDIAVEGESYTTHFTAESGYELPETILIKMDSKILDSGYIYNSTTGEIIIANPTTNITITATAAEIDERVKIQTPTISGKPQVGTDLIVYVNNIDLDNFSIQWYADEEEIYGEKSTTFKVTSEQKGKTIKVGVTPNEENKDYLAIESISAKTDEVYQLYTITFYSGEDNTKEVETTSTGKLSSTTLPIAETLTDNTFIGWFDDEDNRVTLLTTFEDDTNVTARYIKTFSINLNDFNSNETPTYDSSELAGQSINLNGVTEIIIENMENLQSLIITKINDIEDNIVTLKSEIGNIIWTIPAKSEIDTSNLLDLAISFGRPTTLALLDQDEDDFATVINFAHSGDLLKNGEGITLQLPVEGVVTTDTIKFYKLDDDYEIMNSITPVIGKVIEDGIVEAVFYSCSSWGAVVTSAIVETTVVTPSTSTSTNTSSNSNSSSSGGTYTPTLTYELCTIPTLSGMYVSAFNNVLLNELINLNSIDLSALEEYKGSFLGWYYDSDFTNAVDTSNYKMFVVTADIVSNGLYPMFANDAIINDIIPDTNDEIQYTIVDNNTYTPTGVPVISTAVPTTITSTLGRLF